MSKKGISQKQYSSELKKEILERYYKNNETCKALGEIYGISQKTIENWVTKTNNGKDVIIDKRKGNSGRKKEPTLEDVMMENEILKKMENFVIHHREKKLTLLKDSDNNIR